MKSSTIKQHPRARISKLKRTHGRKIKLFLVFSFVCISLGALYGFFQNTDLFVIKRLQVEGAKTYVNKADVLTLVSANTLGKNILSLNAQVLENNIKATFLGVKTAQVTKSITGDVLVKITEREPVALISNKRDTYGVDIDGYVLGILDPKKTNLPKITYEDDIRVGQFIDSKLVPTYMDIIKHLDSEKIKVSSISVTAFDVRMFVGQGTEVLIGRENYDNGFVVELKEVLNYLKTKGKTARRIDLRYDKVILSLN